MEKEILSMQLIQDGFRRHTRSSFVGAVICLPLSLLLVWPTVKVFIITGFWYRTLLLLVFPIGLLILSVYFLREAHSCRKLIKNPQQVLVKDRLVNKESKFYERTKYGPYGEFLYLHFEKYGRYTICKENYLWSELYWHYNEDDMYNSSEIGDEFYLVLSKPCKGLVLYVYNTKLFELQ